MTLVFDQFREGAGEGSKDLIELRGIRVVSERPYVDRLRRHRRRDRATSLAVKVLRSRTKTMERVADFNILDTRNGRSTTARTICESAGCRKPSIVVVISMQL